jgi:Dolichyl-phosphate-mannose-protein mannosyltransferase
LSRPAGVPLAPRDWVFGMIVILAALARFAGMGFGLPLVNCRPDEETLIARSIGFFSGDFNPHFFSYPSLLMYLNYGLYRIYGLLGLASGRFTSSGQVVAEYANDPTRFFLMSRALSGLLGTLSVVVTYRLAARLFGTSVALISGFFLAFAFLHVRDSHFATTDVAATFFILCSYAWIMKAYEVPSARAYLMSGIFAGVATSTKYLGVLLSVPLILVHFKHWKEAGFHRGLVWDRKLLWFAAALLLFFFLGTPFSLAEPLNAFRDFRREARAVLATTGRGHVGWIDHLVVSLRHGLGLPLLLTSLAGIALVVRKEKGKAWILLSFPVVYYALMGRGYRNFTRYAVPLVPFLCIAAGWCVGFLGAAMARRWTPGVRIAMMSLLSCAILLPSLVNSARFDALLLEVDTRVAARQYVESTIAAGESVGLLPLTFGDLDLYPTSEALARQAQAEPPGSIGWRIASARLEAVEAKTHPGYRLWEYDSRSRRFTWGGTIMDSVPDVLILEESPLPVLKRKPPEEIGALASREYSLTKSFLAYGDLSGSVFDELDIFYLPLDGFRNFSRPGPNIFIYERLGKAPA